MRVRRAWPVAALLLAPVLAGCGDDDEPNADPTPTETVTETPTESSSAPTTEATTETTTETTTAAPALPAACELVTADTLAKALGVTFGPGEIGGGATDENGSAWKSDNCAFEAKDLMEVTVKITGPDDFTTGTFGCVQPSETGSIIEPADDIAGATDGWWKVSEPPSFEATLRACSDTVNVDVDLDYEDGVDYEGDPRQQAALLAEHVLGSLQGE